MDVLPSTLSGFRIDDSFGTALVESRNDILEAIDKGLIPRFVWLHYKRSILLIDPFYYVFM